MAKNMQRHIQAVFTFVVVLALVVVAYWLVLRSDTQFDWTQANTNTLSAESIAVVQQINSTLHIDAYVRENNDAVRKAIITLVKRYQRNKTDIVLSFIDPDAEPQQVRDFNITVDGEMLLTLDGAKQNVKSLREQDFTNALHRLSRQADRWLVFITGHGERSATGNANHDLGLWVDELKKKGFNVANANLTETAGLPSNTTLAVIAGSQLDWLPGEVAHVNRYIAAGGNLLWLAEPGDDVGLELMAESLGLAIDGATIVDPLARLVGIDNPTFTIITRYPAHPILNQFEATTLFPQATGVLIHGEDNGWQKQALLLSGEQSWLERGELSGNVRLDDADRAGPISIGVALQREVTTSESLTKNQRIIVMGDGDFIANQYIGNAGNIELGSRIVNWLSSDDHLIDIPSPDRGDRELDLSLLQSQIIAIGFFIAIPALLLIAGGFIWWRRRS